MKKIGIISDTHSFLDPRLDQLLQDCDEIWHAGDIGTLQLADSISNWAPIFRAVYGNIDNHELRRAFPEYQFFVIENVKVLMIHIAGKAGVYNLTTRELIQKFNPDLLVCGHSHILKIIKDEKHKLIYVNPGAVGKHGFHIFQTCVTLCIDKGKVFDLNVIELGRRAAL